MKAVSFESVYEKYHIKFINGQKISWEEIWALEDISFEVGRGQVLGVIGQNGAGKTTLLKLAAGMLIPDKGRIEANGKVSVLMELGAGFNPEFTGRENILINARVYGLEEEVLNLRMDEIIDFAGLGRFIDAPIKYYSQGMYMRLAFALAIYVEPDILLIDDILAVGDEEAQQKCFKKISDLKQSGKTIILATHDMGMISRLADRVILLEKGRIIKEDIPQKAVPAYLETVGEKKGIAVLENAKLRAVFNNGRISVDYEGLPVTKGPGGYLSFFVPALNTWVSSLNLSWQIKSAESGAITAEGRSSDGVLWQVWIIRVHSGKLEWQVQIKEKTQAPQVDIFLSSEYDRWVSLDQNSNFSPFISRHNWHSIDTGSFPEGLLAFTMAEDKGLVSSLALERQDEDGQIKLFNTGYEQEARVVKMYIQDSLICLTVSLFDNKDNFDDYMKRRHARFLSNRQEEARRLLAQRTISSGLLRLFADVENKALRLYYKGRELTAGGGFHSYFPREPAAHSLNTCQWQIEKNGETLSLKFFRNNPYFTQSWIFSLVDNQLLWKINSSCAGSRQPEDFRFGLSLQSGYKTFFCGHQQGSLSPENAASAEVPLEDPLAELFGLRKDADLPAVVFKNDLSHSCSIKNSGADYGCRILDLCLPPDAAKSGEITAAGEFNFLEDESVIESYLEKKNQAFALKQQEEESRAVASRTIVSGPFSLFVDTKNKAVKIYHGEREITWCKGLHASMFLASEPDWLNPLDAEWSTNRVSDKELILIWDYRLLSLRLICAFKWNRGNALDILVEAQAEKAFQPIYKALRLELASGYGKWKTAGEAGDFNCEQCVNSIVPIRLKDSKISSVVLEPSDDSGPFPFLFCLFSPHEAPTLSLFKKAEEDGEHVYVDYSIVIPKETRIGPPEKSILFRARVMPGDKRPPEESAKSTLRLAAGPAELIFDRGKTRIIWRQEQITDGLGIYTSVRSKGIWYDSYQANWITMNESKGNVLIVKGEWPHIPIAQTWRMELREEGLIYWRVDMEVHEEVVLELEQANLMLSSKYKKWLVPEFTGGDFIDEHPGDYDILPFRFWYGKPLNAGLAATGEGLPEISFGISGSFNNGRFKGIIENSDVLHKARLLQYQKANAGKLSPAGYPYFKGLVVIKPQS